MAGHQDLGNDHLIWKYSDDGNFSTQSTYASIRDFPPSSGSNWKHLWQWHGPTRAKYFLWLAVKGGLKTNCLRWERGTSTSDTCPLCGVNVETAAHIIRDCAKHSVVGVTRRSIYRQVGWTPLVEGWVKWNLDGSVISQGASNGGILLDSWGNWLTGLGDTSVWFGSDSITAVNFVKKGVSHHHSCFGIVSAIRNDLDRIQQVHVSHVYREGNFVADALADLGHSYHLDFVWSSGA
ncbi:Ribonuclease H-like superfamily [Sesbania bispinosa]|nr:Ribonuclease H-like superfamily [Sesbania bispinosa]